MGHLLAPYCVLINFKSALVDYKYLCRGGGGWECGGIGSLKMEKGVQSIFSE